MSDNAEQIAEWNGPVGQTWAEQQDEFDRLWGRFGVPALQRAAAKPGERVVDVGCGCGDTSFALARAVGEGGAVLGLDVSQPMLAVAARRAREADLPQVSFREVDASRVRLEPDRDLIFSRFGVMFFDEPQAAFANMRRWLKPNGRMVFACWRDPRDNPWAMAPVAAVREALGLETPPANPTAPGPFALADIERLQRIMTGAGFGRFTAEPFDDAVPLGPLPIAADKMTRFGPASRLVRTAGEHTRPKAAAALVEALKPYAGEDGTVALPGAIWVVSAKSYDDISGT